jgi:hypothetical protein
MRKTICIYLLIKLLIIYYIPFVFAQSGKTVYPHSVFWHKFEINQLDKNNRFGVGLDFVYRRKNTFNQGSMFREPLRESVRPWFHYQFSPYARFSLSPIGYMNTHEYVGKIADLQRQPYHEWRTTFQFFHHIKQLGGRIMHTWRYRYELRWQYNPNEDNYRYFTRFRFRYRIRIGINKADFYENHILYAAISNEIGLNIGKNVTYNTFNQNRLYIGLGYRFLNAARIELRYVNRLRTRGATGIEFDHGQGLMIGAYIDQISLLGTRKGKVQSVRFSD